MENINLQNISIQYKGGGTEEQGQKPFPELEKGYPEPSLLGMNPAYGLFIRHIKNLQLDNITFITLKPEGRPAIIAADVQGLDIYHFTAPKFDGVDITRFNGVTGLVMERSVK